VALEAVKDERAARKVRSTCDVARADAFNYVERFYNQRRRYGEMERARIPTTPVISTARSDTGYSAGSSQIKSRPHPVLQFGPQRQIRGLKDVRHVV
jgi:hypothetical protein